MSTITVVEGIVVSFPTLPAKNAGRMGHRVKNKKPAVALRVSGPGIFVFAALSQLHIAANALGA